MNTYTGNQSNNKRKSERFDSDFQVSLFYGNIVYTGIVTNVSENGMFISTRRNFPVDTMLVTSLIVGEEPLKLPVQIMRKSDNASLKSSSDSGVGVQIVTCSEDYMVFFDKYKASVQQLKLTL
jgi:Tfp pilus assembly protein PilZ